MNYKWIDDDVDYILLRPDTYVGSLERTTIADYKYNIIKNKFEKYDYDLSPALSQIFNEIISNSIDEYNRHKTLKNIKVIINTSNGSINVYDNGNGINVKKYQDTKLYIPEILITKLHSGSNFDDTEQRSTIGRNGVGLTVVNIFSKVFQIETSDSKKKFIMRCERNSKLKEPHKITNSKKHYTSITYIPDYKRFNYDSISNDTIEFMRKKVIDLAGLFPNIKFTFQVDKTKFVYKFKSIKDYYKLFINDNKDFIYYNDSIWNIGISYNENKFEQLSYVNGIQTTDGGTHVKTVTNNILPIIKEKIKKKYNIKLTDYQLQQNIKLLVNVNMNNPIYTTQTKIKLSNNNLPKLKLSNKFIRNLLNSDLFENISNYAIKKQDEKQQREIKKTNKQLNRVKIDNFIDANNRKRLENIIYLFEGDSAKSGFHKFRNNKQGALSLGGKINNIYKLSELTLAKKANNKSKIQNIFSAIGLKIGEYNVKKLRYGKIYISTDADVDGFHISGLLFAMFYKFWKELYDEGRIYRVLTPILVAKYKNTKKMFYTEKDFHKWTKTIKNLNKYIISYKKGLAALTDDEYSEIILNPKLIQYKSDILTDDIINSWFGNDPELRKKILFN